MAGLQEGFLRKAWEAARAAGHLFPEYAACEAALESGWGQSRLATEANNLFGQKQAHPPLPGTETLTLPTREFLHGAWLAIEANWVQFADWEACFRERMALLRSLAGEYPNYRAALAAETGEEFVRMVSRTWSTDPDRAAKVLTVYERHGRAFADRGDRTGAETVAGAAAAFGDGGAATLRPSSGRGASSGPGDAISSWRSRSRFSRRFRGWVSRAGGAQQHASRCCRRTTAGRCCPQGS